ncbi:hypothetical protein Tsubulata_039617, partial [Turnera subulata]
GMGNCFPVDFVEEILAHLPNKSIMRFRCVSKEWSSYLVSDEFYKLRFTLRPHERLLKLTDSGFSFINYEDSLIPSTEQSFPFKKPNKLVDFIGSCDGLVCLSLGCPLHGRSFDSSKQELVLWNPCTGIHREMPKLLDVADYREARAFGFGYAPASCDYKIYIRVILQSQEEVTQIFSLKANSWKKIKNHGENLRGNGLLLNGALHWDDEGVFGAHNIIAFDLEKEEAYDVPSPPLYLLRDVQFAMVGIIGDCLCMHGGWYDTTMPNYDALHIWIMKEYCVQTSWVPLIKVMYDETGLDGCCYDASDMVPQFINNNGYMLMQGEGGDVYLIDTQSECTHL